MARPSRKRPDRFAMGAIRRVLIPHLALAIWLVLGHGHPASAKQSFTWSSGDWGGVGLLQTRNARFGADGTLTIGASFVPPYDRYFVNLQALPWVEGTFRYTLSKDRRLSQNRFNATLTDRGADLKFKLANERKWTPALALGMQDLLGTGLFDGEYVVASKRYFDLDFSLGMAWGYPGNRGTLANPMIFFSDKFRSRDDAFSGLGGIPEFGKVFGGARVGLFGGVEYLTPFEGVRFKLEYDGNDYENEPAGGGDFDVGMPFNFGVEYAPWPWLKAVLSSERDEGLVGGVAIRANLNELSGIPKFAKKPPPPLPPRPPDDSSAKYSGGEYSGETDYGDLSSVDSFFDRAEALDVEITGLEIDEGDVRLNVKDRSAARNSTEWRKTLLAIVKILPVVAERVTVVSSGRGGEDERRVYSKAEIFGALAESGAGTNKAPIADGDAARETELLTERMAARIDSEGFDVGAIELKKFEITVYLTQDEYRLAPQALGRAIRAVAGVAPAGVELITIVFMRSGLQTISTTVYRADFERAAAGLGSPEEVWQRASFDGSRAYTEDTKFVSGRYPDFSWSVAPKFRQHIGRPGQFYRYQFWLALRGEVELFRGFFLSTTLGKNIYHNFGDLESIPDSRVQHVRSEIVNYLNEGENNIVEMSLAYLFSPKEDWYARFSAGYLEEMFAGVAGELLYRPFNSRWAAGIDVAQVFQREFKQKFGLQKAPDLKYDTLTGHFTVYYELPIYGLSTDVSIGRYLAQDIGGTIGVSRLFDSGIRMGGWVTLTDLSADEFGEGSFDKGLFITVPLDLFFPESSRTLGTFPFRPLTRDGGQKLNVSRRLYGLTFGNKGQMGRDWGRLLD